MYGLTAWNDVWSSFADLDGGVRAAALILVALELGAVAALRVLTASKRASAAPAEESLDSHFSDAA